MIRTPEQTRDAFPTLAFRRVTDGSVDGNRVEARAMYWQERNNARKFRRGATQ